MAFVGEYEDAASRAADVQLLLDTLADLAYQYEPANADQHATLCHDATTTEHAERPFSRHEWSATTNAVRWGSCTFAETPTHGRRQRVQPSDDAEWAASSGHASPDDGGDSQPDQRDASQRRCKPRQSLRKSVCFISTAEPGCPAKVHPGLCSEHVQDLA